MTTTTDTCNALASYLIKRPTAPSSLSLPGLKNSMHSADLVASDPPPPPPPPPGPPPPPRKRHCRRSKHKPVSPASAAHTPLRIVALNINHLSNKIFELNVWLNQQIAVDTPVHVLLLNEPCLTPDLASLLDKKYLIATPAPGPLYKDGPVSDSPTNEHHSTAIIFLRDHRRVSLHQPTLSTRHPSVTTIQAVLAPTDPLSSIHFICAYLPNPRAATLSYKRHLTASIKQTLNEVKALGSQPVLYIDGNCPFNSPQVPSNLHHENLTFINALTELPDLRVANWSPSAHGPFQTRQRGTSSSHLDLVLTDELVSRNITSIIVDPVTNFDSDHFRIDLLISISSPEKARPRPRKHIHFAPATPTELLSYEAALSDKLPLWLRNFTAGLSGEKIRASTPQAEKFLSDNINAFTTIIYSSYKDTVCHRFSTFPPTKQTVAPDSTTTTLARERDQARTSYQEACNSGAPSSHKLLLKTNYSDCVSRLKHHIATAQHSEKKSLCAKLQQDFDTDKQSFYETHKKLFKPAKSPLPDSLFSDGREIRNTEKIKALWIKRFNLPPTNPSASRHVEFKHHVELEVKKYSDDTSHDSDPTGNPFSSGNLDDSLTKASAGKSPDEKGILNEMVKPDIPILRSCLLSVMNALLLLLCVPLQWKNVPITPVYKKLSRLSVSNYRPIGCSSNILKIYERLIDQRIRSVIFIIPEQAGFRAGFSPHTILTRLSILIGHARYTKNPIYLIFLDYQEAFERAWRDGILYRLWEAGIRGRLWRACRNLLQDTFYYIRTNFGNTSSFKTYMGVVQGSVLAALFFTLLITPLSDALRPFSPIIRGLTIAPQFFADDSTLAHTSEPARTALLTLTLEWSAKWLSTVKPSKTFGLSSSDAPLPGNTIINGVIFKEVSAAISLGVGISRNGLFDTKHAASLITRVGSRVMDLVTSGATCGYLRMDIVIFIYQMSAFSLLLHSISATSFRNCSLSRLDKAQESFARKLLDLPATVHGPSATAELGLPRVSLICARSNLLSLHRIYSNTLDTITKNMFDWPCCSDGRTTLDLSNQSLAALGCPLPTLSFFALPYIQAKALLERQLYSTQMKQWSQAAGCQPATYHLTNLTKPCWGIESHLASIHPIQVRTMLRARLGIPLSLFPTDRHCPCCHLTALTLQHALWICPSTQSPRSSFMTLCATNQPETWMLISPCTPLDKTILLLGAIAPNILPPNRQPFFNSSTRFITRVIHLFDL